MNALGRDTPEVLTGQVLEAALRVRGSLGFGCPRATYANALAMELGRCGLEVGRQLLVHIQYAERVGRDIAPTLVVDGELIVDVKTLPALGESHRRKCEEYLRATDLRACLLLNFGHPRLEAERFVHPG
jgi:GxxExxY protein